MPLSRKRDKIRKRRERAAQRLLGSEEVLRRRLWDMKLIIEAKQARIEWQSSGIMGLHDEIARLKALLATQPAMQDTEVLKRVAALETEHALHEAEHGVEVEAEERGRI